MAGTNAAVKYNLDGWRSRLARIRDLEEKMVKTSSQCAWSIGKELFDIRETQTYSVDGGFESFNDFVETARDKGGLGMSYATANCYIKVFASFDYDFVGWAGWYVLANLAGAPEPFKKKMMCKDSTGVPLIAKYSKTEFMRLVGIEKQKVRNKTGCKKPGRREKYSSTLKRMLKGGIKLGGKLIPGKPTYISCDVAEGMIYTNTDSGTVTVDVRFK